MLCAGPSSSAGGRGRETRDWKGPGLSARQMSLSKPKTLRVSLTAAVTHSFTLSLVCISYEC